MNRQYMQLTPKRLIMASLLTGAAVFLFAFNPETTAYLPCIFKKLTGLQCPGCGSARASYHLLHGNLFTAIDYNFLLVLFSPFLIIEIIYRFGLITQASRFHSRRITLKSYHVLFLVLIFWVVRNIPFFPFHEVE